MKEFLYNLIKLVGVSDGGIVSLIYAVYLKCFKKLPYVIDSTIKPEAQETYLKIEYISFFAYFIIFLSLILFLTLTSFPRGVLCIIHFIIIMGIFLLKVWLKKDLYK